MTTISEQLKKFDEKFEYGNINPALVGKGDVKLFIRQACEKCLEASRLELLEGNSIVQAEINRLLLEIQSQLITNIKK